MKNKEPCAHISEKTVKMQESFSSGAEPTAFEQQLSEINSQLAKKNSKLETMRQVKKEQLAKLASLQQSNEEQSLAVEQRQQNEDDWYESHPLIEIDRFCLQKNVITNFVHSLNDLLAVVINSFRSQFNDQLEFFRHKEQMRCNLEQLQACNKKRIELEMTDCEEKCISQKDRGM